MSLLNKNCSLFLKNLNNNKFSTFKKFIITNKLTDLLAFYKFTTVATFLNTFGNLVNKTIIKAIKT